MGYSLPGFWGRYPIPLHLIQCLARFGTRMSWTDGLHVGVRLNAAIFECIARE